MNTDRYIDSLPAIQNWIEMTLAAHVDLRRPVQSFGFRRLPLYFSDAILKAASVVLVDQVPSPPLTALGLEEFKSFEALDMAGITFRDTYFLRANYAGSESLHFHELVHVVQWKVLGPEDFLLLYADGLARHGYDESPLELMAFCHQAQFDAGQSSYAVGDQVLAETLALAKLHLRPGRGAG